MGQQLWPAKSAPWCIRAGIRPSIVCAIDSAVIKNVQIAIDGTVIEFALELTALSQSSKKPVMTALSDRAATAEKTTNRQKNRRGRRGSRTSKLGA
jgi:hypothetical protein